MLSARALQFVRSYVSHLVRSYTEAAPSGTSAMSFTFASPSQVFYNGFNVKQVDLPTTMGIFGILASHLPTLQVLRPELVTVFSDDGSETKYFVSSGYVTVNADFSVQLLAEEAVKLDILDTSTARSNLEKAQAVLQQAGDEVAKAEALVNVEACEAIVKAL
ncbi:ATP synthase subunit delta, mitochondrial-like [Rana temporaria]|uniref:ATP synthase subunit delta, mitochondrial-like n=1 Tax=Rana temporaria TaxID=8407 RepID=UPI001AACB89A|nr:ATP synthase subunit delta, mitochondrial-like [Rana temporaria]